MLLQCDCRLISLPRHKDAICFMVEEYEEHMFGQAGGQRRSFRSQGWLGSGMCRKTPPFPPITVGASKNPGFSLCN